MSPSPEDIRFDRPLYTYRQAASYLGVPTSTFSDWAKGYRHSFPNRSKREVVGEPLVTAVPAGGGPRVPFIGLAEGLVVAAFRRTGVSLQHIRKALHRLEEEVGLEHALASKRLYTDGARLLYDYADESSDEELGSLTVLVSGQRVFVPVVLDYLQRVTFAADGWAQKLFLPITERHLLEIDPMRGFGRPLVAGAGAPMQEILDRFVAGEPLEGLAYDFDVRKDDLEDVIRAGLRHAA